MKNFIYLSIVVLVLFPLFFNDSYALPQLQSEESILSQFEKNVNEILQVAFELKNAILKKDIETLLKYSESEKDLMKYREEFSKGENSSLYCGLLNTNCFLEHLKKDEGLQEKLARKYNIQGKIVPSFMRTSVYDFFRKNPDFIIEIHFIDYPVNPEVKKWMHKYNLKLTDIVDIIYKSPQLKTENTNKNNWHGYPLKLEGDLWVGNCLIKKEKGVGWQYNGGIFWCPKD